MNNSSVMDKLRFKPRAIKPHGVFYDNNCNGEVNEGCSKILYFVEGSTQQGEICETLDYMKLKVGSDSSDKVWEGVEIGWELTSKPNGADDADLESSSTESGEDGITENRLTLGDRPGEYNVKATCVDCEYIKDLTFKAEAICPTVPSYMQNDSAWSDSSYADICKKPRDSNWDGKIDDKDTPGVVKCSAKYPEKWGIGKKGCALTTIAMMVARYRSSDNPVPIDTLNSLFKDEFDLYKGKGYAIEGDVLWNQIAELTQGHVYVDFDYYSNASELKDEILQPLSNGLINQHLEKCTPVIVAVNNNGSRHWVVVTDIIWGEDGSVSDYLINDPGYGNRRTLFSEPYNGKIYKIRIYSNKAGGCPPATN